jgi:hypothetical protein
MRLTDIVADKLVNTNLMEMAFQRKHVQDKITDISYQLGYHIIKTLVFPTSMYKNHWLKEIDTWLRKIDGYEFKQKKNKRPTYEQYEEWILNGWELHNHLGKILKRIKMDYTNEKMKLPNQLGKEYQAIMRSICKDLAKDELKDIKEYI